MYCKFNININTTKIKMKKYVFSLENVSIANGS